MVQLTHDEMNCIRGGYLTSISSTLTTVTSTTPVIADPTLLLAIASGDKRTPRPGSGGVSA